MQIFILRLERVRHIARLAVWAISATAGAAILAMMLTVALRG